MYADQRIELAHRKGDGIDVTLWWSRETGAVSVEVLHFATESAFELNVAPDRALDAFYHPFAYAAQRTPEVLELAA